MNLGKHFSSPVLLALIFAFASFAGSAQDNKTKSSLPAGKPVLWEQVNIADRDLYYGPGGEAMAPDVSKVTFLKEELQGHNKKYRIKDAKGMEWVAKFGTEAQPETAALRILYGLGYKTEINYLVPSLTIPGKGTFQNVRLEARPANFDRQDIWKWSDNPFVGSDQLQGLKIMMVFFTNWDLLDLQNKVIRVNNNGQVEDWYVISDLGATFGKVGNNNLPFFFRIGRQTNKPEAWEQAGFISSVKGNKIDWDFRGKGRSMMDDITLANARWLADQLKQLSDKQVTDAFRAAGYTPDQITSLLNGFKSRVTVLDNAASHSNAAGN